MQAVLDTILKRLIQIGRLTVYWPDGKSERFTVPALRQYTTLVQGTGVEAQVK